MTTELLDRRVLGAIEFIDGATQARVRTPLKVVADGLRLMQNASGLYVIHVATGLDEHTRSFESMPATPAFESLPPFTLNVSDDSGQYLPRTASIRLPRRDAPVGVDGSVQAPLRVVLLRQAHAAIGPQWALLRLRVSLDSAPAVGLANVLVRLTTAVAPAPVQGMTDRHGEAVLAVIGAPLLVGLKREFSATLRLRLDRAVVARSDTKDIAVPDPDLIESRAADGVTGVATVDGGTVQLAAGREARMVLAAALP